MATDILIFGAGAVGSFYGSRLAHAPNTRVSVVCRSNYPAVKSSGFTVTSPQYPTEQFRPYQVFPNAAAAAQGPVKTWSYIIVSTKALPDVTDDSALLSGLVNEDTAIVLVQNGIGVEEPYAARFPHASILSAVTIVSAAQPHPGQIQHNRWTRISIGPYIPPSRKEDASKIATAAAQTATLVRLLKDGGIKDAEAYQPSQLQLLRWHKLALNAAMNPTSVLTHGASNAAMALDPEVTIHIKGVMHEITTAAKAVTGQDFPKGWATPEEVLASTKRNKSGSRPSMWADWVGGGGMELQVILGNAVEAGRERGVEMPRCQGMWACLRMAQVARDRERGERSKL